MENTKVLTKFFDKLNYIVLGVRKFMYEWVFELLCKFSKDSKVLKKLFFAYSSKTYNTKFLSSFME